jgi:hypothetical protein
LERPAHRANGGESGMTHQAHKFRVRYFGKRGTLHDIEISARDTTTAIRAAREVQWPPNAIGFRLVDIEGREVFEQLKSDLR